jgi:5,10-methylenetetrahydrofolate reductase
MKRISGDSIKMKRSFKEALTSGKFLVTAEVASPKGIDAGSLGPIVGNLKDTVDAIGVGDNPRGVMSMSPWAACHLISESGGEPIMHLTCRDRNRMALQSDLLAAAFLGIRNVLCVTGDHVRFGDHIDAMPVYDLDSVQLIEAVLSLTGGRDMTGHELTGAPEFCVGAVANPESDPVGPQLFKFKKKLASGIDFVLTHPVFNPDNLAPFVSEAKEKGVKVIAGVSLLVAEEIPGYKDGSHPGLFVPDEVLADIEGAGIEKGIEIAARLIGTIKDKGLCDGVHISALGHEEKIIDIIKSSGI